MNAFVIFVRFAVDASNSSKSLIISSTIPRCIGILEILEVLEILDILEFLDFLDVLEFLEFASQMLPGCQPDASQVLPRCLPDASQMPSRCIPAASQLHHHSIILLYDFSSKDSSSIIPRHWFLLHDSSSWFTKKLSLGSRAGVIHYFRLSTH